MAARDCNHVSGHCHGMRRRFPDAARHPLSDLDFVLRAACASIWESPFGVVCGAGDGVLLFQQRKRNDRFQHSPAICLSSPSQRGLWICTPSRLMGAGSTSLAYVLFSSEEAANVFREAEPELMQDARVEQLDYRTQCANDTTRPALSDVLEAWIDDDPLMNFYVVVDPVDRTPVQGLLGFHTSGVTERIRQCPADADAIKARSFDLVTM